MASWKPLLEAGRPLLSLAISLGGKMRVLYLSILAVGLIVLTVCVVWQWDWLYSHPITTSAVVVLCLLGALLGRGTTWLSKAKPASPPATVDTEPKKILWARISEAYSEHYVGQKAWSAAYHITFGLATVAGVVATAINGHPSVQLKFLDIGHSGLVGALTGLTTLLTAIGGFGGFERKWRANRITATRLWLLRQDLETPDPNLKEIKANLQTYMNEHDASVLGEQGKK